MAKTIEVIAAVERSRAEESRVEESEGQAGTGREWLREHEAGCDGV